MAYIPKYMGDIASYINTGVQYKGQNPSEISLKEEQKQENLNSLTEVALQPITNQVSYLWNINLRIQMAGEITRICSRNHKVQFELSSDQKTAHVNLHESERTSAPHKDFVLLIRDSNISKPVALTSTNEF